MVGQQLAATPLIGVQSMPRFRIALLYHDCDEDYYSAAIRRMFERLEGEGV